MRARIAERFPQHSVLGEEFEPAEARYRWVLDPVDGTILFTLGVPTFGTLVGLLEDGGTPAGRRALPGSRRDFVRLTRRGLLVAGEADGVVFSGSLVTSCDAGLHGEVLAVLNAPS